jgi:hypothetical protein
LSDKLEYAKKSSGTFATRKLEQQYEARMKLAAKWMVAGRSSRELLRLRHLTEGGDTVSVDLRDLSKRERFCSQHAHDKMIVPCEHVIYAIRVAENKALDGDISQVILRGSLRTSAVLLYSAGGGLSVPSTDTVMASPKIKRPTWLKVVIILSL